MQRPNGAGEWIWRAYATAQDVQFLRMYLERIQLLRMMIGRES
jgi:hypothetical protein